MRRQAGWLCAMIWGLSLTGLGGPMYGKESEPQPGLTFSKPGLDFGETLLGVPAERSVTIRNRSGSSQPLEIRESDATVFRLVQHDCGCCLAADKSCTLKIRFSPLIAQKVSETLSIQYLPGDGPPHVVRFPLSGSGKERIPVVLPPALRFPPQQIGLRSAAQTVGIFNQGAGSIDVTRVAIAGDFFLDPAGLPQSLPSLGTTRLAIRFVPQATGVRTGKLSIWIGAEAAPRVVPLRGLGTRSFWRSCEDWHLSNLGLTLLLSLLYLLGMVTARWHRVAMPTRELLRAQIEALRVEISALPPQTPANPNAIDPATLLDKAVSLLGTSRWPSPSDFLFWSRGQENAGWAYVHEVEIQIAGRRDDAFVKARLETLETLLRQLNEVSATELAERIHLDVTSTASTVDQKRRRALLAEALAATYQRTDHAHSDLMDWQNKSSWLVVCGVVLIVVLVWAYPEHAVLFVMGAMGGLLSRLSRTLTSKDLPTDYGASWTTLFLSPVSGALGGWVGILLASLAVQLGVLGKAFDVAWAPPFGALALGVAVVFGFSERLLSSVLDKVAGKAEEGSDKPALPPASKPPLKVTVAPILKPGKVGVEYNLELTATGAIGDVSWKLADGSADLPQGLRVRGNAIQGTPTEAVPKRKIVLEARNQDKTAQLPVEITIEPADLKPPE